MIRKHFKGILMSILKGILFTPIFGILCIFDMGNTDDLKDPMHWIAVGVISILFFIGWYYFKEINPRKSVTIGHNLSTKKTIILSILFLIGMFGWIPAIILTKNNIISLCVFILSVFILMFSFWRLITGVKIFRGNNILIVSENIRYYKNASIDKVDIIGESKYVILNIIINGCDNYFLVNKKKALKYQEEILKLE